MRQIKRIPCPYCNGDGDEGTGARCGACYGRGTVPNRAPWIDDRPKVAPGELRPVRAGRRLSRNGRADRPKGRTTMETNDPRDRDWRDLLHPGRFDGMSPKMAALVGCISGRKYTDPEIVEISITSDGHLLATLPSGRASYEGIARDLERNWRNLLDAAGLTDEQRAAAAEAYRDAVTDWRTAAPAGWRAAPTATE